MKKKLWIAVVVVLSVWIGSGFGQLRVKSNTGTELMRVQNDGKVGIGTDAPAYTLDVMGGISGAYTPRYSVYQSHGQGQGGAAIYNDNDTVNELMIVGNTIRDDGDRNVGIWDHLYVPRSVSIGTRAKNAKLSVAGPGPDNPDNPDDIVSNTTLSVLHSAIQDHSTSGVSSFYLVDPAVTNGSIGYGVKTQMYRPNSGATTSVASGFLAFFDGYYPAGDAIRISGVDGTIWADEANYYLADPPNSTVAAILGGVHDNSPENDRIYGLYIFGAKSRFDKRVGINREPDPAYMLDVNGNIRCNAVTQTSDARLKSGIEPLSHALDRVSALQGVAFNWADPSMGDDRQIGFIAQEVEKVLPEVVTTDGKGYKSLAYDRMTSVLVEAIKELKARDESQRTEIADLKSQLRELLDR